ncbi:alpha/beta hydrolase [Zhongshania sp.]|uniref:alpha/beta hydrolase n=1 Tax=Zhongshania sp. TaxID=1971902 RepID=UPI0035690DE9
MTRHLIHPELVAAVDALPIGEIDAASLPARRAAMAAMAAPLEIYARETIATERRSVPGPAGAPDVEVIIYRPRAPSPARPVYLNIHGGGYIFGVAALNGPGNMRIADELDCVVISVEYRLAPETPAPGAVEDCYAALSWVFTNADELGIDRERIAVGGESAGGGLAAALTILARDRGEIPICFQLLTYPMLDDRTVTTTTPNPVTGEFVWTPQANRFAWTALLGQEPGAADVSPYAAPARASDLSNLPPAYISVGALDLFVDEDIAYAQRLLRAGVPTELHIIPGAFHAFEMAYEASITIAAQSERREALRCAFGGEEKNKSSTKNVA